MQSLPQPLIEIAARVAASGGIIAFGFEALIIVVMFRALRLFQAEVAKVDGLVSEYVRCRDFLLASRRTAGASGWRDAGDEGFREAWLNFNNHLAVIRGRYRSGAGRLKLWLVVLLVMVILNALAWGFAGGLGSATALRLIGGVLAPLTALLLWGAAWLQIRRQKVLIDQRTEGNYLIAPWPAEGASMEKQYALLEKFLPVVQVEASPETEPAPEAL
jgi:hypothetical protein